MEWSPENTLDFGPQRHSKGRWAEGSRADLLWPVLAWRVMAPQPRERKMNVLQRAVLRFHNAGVVGPRIADLLSLDTELVALVTSELIQRQWLTAQGGVTPRGQAILDEEELDLAEVRTGWVFQDAFTGRLLPRFVTGLRYADVEVEGKTAFRVVGTKGSPRRYQATWLKPGDNRAALPPPEAQEVLRAAFLHQRHKRRLDRSDLDLDVAMPDRVDRVTLIADEPEPVFLFTFVYSPEFPESGDPDWLVAEPFGFGASPELRETLIKVRDAATGKYRELLDSITFNSPEKRRVDFDDADRILREEAVRMVADRLPVEMSASDCQIRQRLEAAFQNIAKFNLQRRAPAPDSVMATYLFMRQALESALRLIRTEYPPGESWRKLVERGKNSWDINGACIARCAADLGFAKPLPKPILHVPRHQVKKMCERQDAANLRPLMSALLLSATNTSGHPFKRLAEASPRWLHLADDIATSAGGLVHNEIESPLKVKVVRDAEGAVKLCRQLLECMNSTSGQEVQF